MTVLGNGTPIIPGSLIIVYSNNVIGLTNGAFQLLTDDRTGCIVFNHNSGPITGTHELFHAFRWGNWLPKELIWNDIYSWAFNRYHILPPLAASMMQQRASEYAGGNAQY